VTRPLPQWMLRDIFLDVASTPPSQGGECRRRKSRREFIHSFYDRAVIDRAYSRKPGVQI